MRNGRPFLAIVKKTSKKILHYLNPIDHLGERNYSIAFALTFSLLVFLVAEIFAYYVLSDPNDITTYIIFVNIATVIYFSFRSGIRAGLLSTLLSLLYYAYLIISRGYTDQRLASGIEVASLLGILYAIIAIVIGWLKQTIDVLISKEQLGRRRAKFAYKQY